MLETLVFLNLLQGNDIGKDYLGQTPSVMDYLVTAKILPQVQRLCFKRAL